MLRPVPAGVPQPTSVAVPSCVCCGAMVRTQWQRRPLLCVALAAARREGVPCLIRQSSRHVGDLQPAGRYSVVLGGTRWYSEREAALPALRCCGGLRAPKTSGSGPGVPTLCPPDHERFPADLNVFMYSMITCGRRRPKPLTLQRSASGGRHVRHSGAHTPCGPCAAGAGGRHPNHSGARFRSA